MIDFTPLFKMEKSITATKKFIGLSRLRHKRTGRMTFAKEQKSYIGR